jgi:hypothetical protein
MHWYLVHLGPDTAGRPVAGFGFFLLGDCVVSCVDGAFRSLAVDSQTARRLKQPAWHKPMAEKLFGAFVLRHWASQIAKLTAHCRIVAVSASAVPSKESARTIKPKWVSR